MGIAIPLSNAELRVSTLRLPIYSSARSIIGANLKIVGKRLHIDDKRKLLDEGSHLLRKAYINECTKEDYMALSLIQELRGYMSGAQ